MFCARLSIKYLSCVAVCIILLQLIHTINFEYRLCSRSTILGGRHSTKANPLLQKYTLQKESRPSVLSLRERNTGCLRFVLQQLLTLRAV